MWNCHLCRIGSDAQIVFPLCRALIHYYRYYLPVRINKRGCKQLAPTGGAAYSLRTGLNELGKMSDVIISRCIDQLTCFGIGVNRRKTEIRNMIWTTCFV